MCGAKCENMTCMAIIRRKIVGYFFIFAKKRLCKLIKTSLRALFQSNLNICKGAKIRPPSKVLYSGVQEA